MTRFLRCWNCIISKLSKISVANFYSRIFDKIVSKFDVPICNTVRDIGSWRASTSGWDSSFQVSYVTARRASLWSAISNILYLYIVLMPLREKRPIKDSIMIFCCIIVNFSYRKYLFRDSFLRGLIRSPLFSRNPGEPHKILVLFLFLD